MIDGADFKKWLSIFGITSGGGGGGSVTNVGTGTGLTGGPITTTGIISLASIADQTFLANTSGLVAPPVPTPLSTFLLAANNLSDLSNNEAGFTNLGLGSGEDLIIDEADFVLGLYKLTNPCPNLIFVNSETPGNVIQLPIANEPDSFIPSQGPVFILQAGFEAVEIQDDSGSPIVTLEAPGCEQFVLTSNATPDGVWYVRSFASTVNNLSGDVMLTGLNIDAAYTPVNYSPIDSTIAGNLAGIDNALGTGGSQSLQDAYDTGDNAEVSLSSNRPVKFLNENLVSAINAIDTQATGTNTVANYRILGWTFVPTVDMEVVALQYDDVWFTSATTRETGIYNKVTQELLGSVTISQTDPLDSTNTYRTKALNSPISLVAGTAYVFATVIPGGQSDFINDDAVPSADITLTERASGPSSPSPIPLQYPQNFNVVSNSAYIGSFQYSTSTVLEEVDINDPDSNDSVIFNVSSTTRSSHPFPSMTAAQRGAVVSPSVGDVVNDTDNNAFYRYNGSQWTQLITNLTAAPYLVITNSVGFPNTGLGTIARYYNSIEFSVDGIISLPNVTNVNTVRRGYPIFLKNNSLFVATIGTSGGTDLFKMYPGDFYALWNDTNTTSDGTWVFENITSAMNYNDVTGTSAQMYPNNIYTANNAGLVTLPLPTVCPKGKLLRVDGFGAGGWIVTQSAGQQCFYEGSNTTLGVLGTIASTNSKATMSLRCVVDDLTFLVEDTTGAINLV